MNESNRLLCLDPSCFTSLENLQNTISLLEQPELKDHHMVVPTEIYHAILSEPTKKFRQLDRLLRDWFHSENQGIPETEKVEYRKNMQKFLGMFPPSPAIAYLGDTEKIGENSIHKEDLFRFGEATGRILFEIFGTSWKHKSKIIAFGEKSFALMKKIGTVVKIGQSKVKKALKKHARITSYLTIAIMFMEGNGITDFLKELEIEGIQVNMDLLPAAGLILVANGSSG